MLVVMRLGRTNMHIGCVRYVKLFLLVGWRKRCDGERLAWTPGELFVSLVKLTRPASRH